jgi:hypothetical protein
MRLSRGERLAAVVIAGPLAALFGEELRRALAALLRAIAGAL